MAPIMNRGSISKAEHNGQRLPMAALLALAMSGFICIMTETLPAGLLPQMAAGLHVTSAWAGQTVTAYAAGSLLAAMPLSMATAGWRRRKVLLLAISGFLVFNAVTACSTSLWLTLVARFLAGMAAGLAWSLIAGYARRMVAAHQQGQAMAVAMVGTPVALAVGVPLGTWLGGRLGWGQAFGLMSLVSLLLIGWILAVMPDYAGQAAHQRLPLRRVLLTPGVRRVLATVIFWMLAHNVLYTYIAPFAGVSGMQAGVDRLLLLFGIAALAGIWLSGRRVDHGLRQTVLWSLAAFVAAALALVVAGQRPVVVVGAVFIWGLSFGGAATLLQTALADCAGEGADTALAMNVVAWNSAIAGGGVLGGLLLHAWGAEALPGVVALLAGMAWIIVRRGRRHGFAPGARQGHPLSR
ncbi:arabinose efflux permease family protein [Frateuria aurantia DSM 6220]|uniref:Arabinose efflux permease family protein n=2 Tax=Frateuria aurantia TaxID=81475 RepID=H8L370_FRAAD|nr:arabinose efflux permease family protein [Frateuria aurantia DSM 6220]